MDHFGFCVLNSQTRCIQESGMVIKDGQEDTKKSLHSESGIWCNKKLNALKFQSRFKRFSLGGVVLRLLIISFYVP